MPVLVGNSLELHKKLILCDFFELEVHFCEGPTRKLLICIFQKKNEKMNPHLTAPSKIEF